MKTDLQKLLSIPGYGKPTYSGNYYSIKFRIPVQDKYYTYVKALKARYPEMILHTALTGFWLIGGTFSKTSNFAFEVKRYLKINCHEQVRSSH
jgi:hypothetical protein